VSMMNAECRWSCSKHITDIYGLNITFDFTDDFRCNYNRNLPDLSSNRVINIIIYI